MSAALDINVFSNYFTSCPVFHVQGKCYPVTEYFLEDVLQLTDHLSQSLEIGVWDTEAAQANGKGNWFGLNEKMVFDTWIENVFVQDNPEILQSLAVAIKDEVMPVNYRHSKTNLTPLMIVAGTSSILIFIEFICVSLSIYLYVYIYFFMCSKGSSRLGRAVFEARGRPNSINW